MKWVVVGAGGVGGYFGGKLAQAGEDVTFVARGKHLAAMKATGLRLRAVDETFVVPPGHMHDNLMGAAPAEVVLFCVKTYDTQDAAALLAPCLTEHTRIVCLQNGVDNAEKLQRLLPAGTTSGGAAYIYANVAEPGTIAQTGGPRKIVIGEVGPLDERAKEILSRLIAAGIKAEISTDLAAALWTKFIFISAVGGVTALTRLTLREILEVDESRALLEAAMRETEAIARALHIQVAQEVVANILETIRSMDTNTYSSMYHDLTSGKPLEVEAFAGTIGRYGRELGIPTPTHDLIYAALLPHHRKHLAARSMR